MEPRTKLIITFSFAVVLVTSLYFFTDWFSKVTGYFLGEDENERLARCLSNKGAEFYGSVYSADSAAQIEMFGPAFKLVNYIECGRKVELCPDIKQIPAWFINDEIHYRSFTLEELKSISDCSDDI